MIRQLNQTTSTVERHGVLSLYSSRVVESGSTRIRRDAVIGRAIVVELGPLMGDDVSTPSTQATTITIINLSIF
jgi:hypothetical protein